jgi:hypothetical protein
MTGSKKRAPNIIMTTSHSISESNNASGMPRNGVMMADSAMACGINASGKRMQRAAMTKASVQSRGQSDVFHSILWERK